MPKTVNSLVDGYKKFRQKYFDGKSQVFEELKNSQNPKFLVVACCDSRVDPAVILNCERGDLFVVRNVANLIPPYENDHGYHGTSAALEFAVLGLGVEHIIIFGHSNCGGIRSLFEENQKIGPNSFIGKWMEISRPAFNKTISQYPVANLDVKVKHCSHFALINSSKNLLTFPWINERVDSGKLFVHAWYFDIESGKIEEFSYDSNNFSELEYC